MDLELLYKFLYNISYGGIGFLLWVCFFLFDEEFVVVLGWGCGSGYGYGFYFIDDINGRILLLVDWEFGY